MKKTVLFLVAVILIAVPAIGASAKSDDSVHGSLTWYQTNSHGAATHYGDSKPTFVQGAVLKLVNGGRSTWVKVNDTCDGSGCQTLDVDPSTFTRLGVNPSKGVVKVTILCGRHGQLPMRTCLAGEG